LRTRLHAASGGCRAIYDPDKRLADLLIALPRVTVVNDEYQSPPRALPRSGLVQERNFATSVAPVAASAGKLMSMPEDTQIAGHVVIHFGEFADAHGEHDYQTRKA